MPVSTTKSKEQYKKKSASGGGRHFSGLNKFTTWILRILGIILILCLLFGIINQAAFAGKAFDVLLGEGTEVAKTINYIFKNDDNSPVDISDQGMYIRGNKPEEQYNEDIQDKKEDVDKSIDEVQKAGE